MTHDRRGQGQEYYETRYRQRVVNHLFQRAAKFGMKMASIEQGLWKTSCFQRLANVFFRGRDVSLVDCVGLG